MVVVLRFRKTTAWMCKTSSFFVSLKMQMSLSNNVQQGPEIWSTVAVAVGSKLSWVAKNQRFSTAR